MQFHETRGGHEFYYGTMPKIAEALEKISKNVSTSKIDLSDVKKLMILKDAYESNKVVLNSLNKEDSFENGYNNALEFTFKTLLGDDYKEILNIKDKEGRENE